MWAVLPIKDLPTAKKRLSPALAPVERHALFRAMVEDVLGTLARTAGVSGILVVTRDRDASALARRVGARVLAEPVNEGQTPAVALGIEVLAAEGAAHVLVMPADVPLATPGEIGTLLGAHPSAAPAVSIVPAHDGRGSNALVCSPPQVMRLQFGDDSFAPHLARARGLGLEPRVVKLPGIGLDVDNPVDLQRFAAAPSDTRAWRYLHDSGILKRLCGRRPGTPDGDEMNSVPASCPAWGRD